MNILRRLTAALVLALTLWAQPSLAAVTWRAGTFSLHGTSDVGPLNATEPTVSQGNVLVAFFYTTNAGTIGPPAGWTTIATGTVGNFNVGFGYEAEWYLVYITRGASAPSLAFTHDNTGAQIVVVEMFSIQGSGTITLDSQSAAGTSGTGTVVANPPATIAVATTSLSIAFGFHWAGLAAEFAAPSGYTERHTVTNDSAGIATKALAAAGSEDPGIFGGTANGSSFYWNGMTVTFTDSGASVSRKTLLLGVGQ